MKYNLYLTVTMLFFGIIAFGQEANSSLALLDNTMVSNQTQWNTENEIEYSLKEKDTTKSKEMRDVPWFVNRYQVSFGFYGGFNNTNIQLNSKDGEIGTEVDFENDLGYDSYTSSIFADFQWRSSSRSRFVLSYYNLRRDTSYTIDEEFDFGDNTYPIDAEINSYFNTSVFRFSYGYAILSKPKYEVGLSIGTHLIDMEFGIGLVTDDIDAQVSDSADVTAPLPDFGIWGGYAFSDKFAVNGEFDFFAVEIENIDGEILNYNISATYKASTHFNITAGINSLNTYIDITGKRADAEIDWGNNGISLRVAYVFGKKKWK
jgi:hypothetical protein